MLRGFRVTRHVKGDSVQTPPCGHLRAGISAQTCPCRHLRAGISVQTCPCRHFGANVSKQTPPCRLLRAGTSVQAPPCRHLRADTSVQRALRVHFCASIPTPAWPPSTRNTKTYAHARFRLQSSWGRPSKGLIYGIRLFVVSQTVPTWKRKRNVTMAFSMCRCRGLGATD